MEILDVLLNQMERKQMKDQFYLVLFEPRCGDLLYALLLERTFSVEVREKLLRVRISCALCYMAHDSF